MATAKIVAGQMQATLTANTNGSVPTNVLSSARFTRIDNAAVRLNGSPVTVHVPDSAITFSPAATGATTTYDAATDTWLTTLPAQFSGNAFLGAAAFPVTTALPGGINPVSWQGHFTSDTPGVSVKFNGAAAGFTVNSAVKITATVPAGALTGPISVTTSAGTVVSGSNFTVLP